MQIFKRPPKPKDFDDYVSSPKQAIALAFANIQGKSVPEFVFRPSWQKYKKHFAKAQKGKCGYCETFVISNQYGDVEHFFPKGAVWILRKTKGSKGKEVDWLATVSGRRYEVISELGYWWLAYDWSNYLLACQICNQQWKSSFFPIKERRRNLPPKEDGVETPLLINPFGGHSPSEHLSFDTLGQVSAKGKSIYGAATIEVCGLDREGLRMSRVEKARQAFRLIGKLLKTSPKETKFAHILDEFRELGSEEYAHSGMVRIIFEENSGLNWSEVFG